ncbi:MAG: rod shape-determining protein RodA [Flammeovirgaceae bacterium]|nr:rod shape-determining protein RodA [Flammeovirgaceae bacterium]
MMYLVRFLNKKILYSLTILICLFSCNSKNSNDNSQEESNENLQTKRVFFKWPRDGATLASPVYIDMGLEGMLIEPAGPVKEGYGHHHILINQTHWPKGSVIPTSDSTLHYGKGQTDVSLDLLPGEYLLTLQFADGVHASFGKEMANSITIIVE